MLHQTPRRNSILPSPKTTEPPSKVHDECNTAAPSLESRRLKARIMAQAIPMTASSSVSPSRERYCHDHHISMILPDQRMPTSMTSATKWLQALSTSPIDAGRQAFRGFLRLGPDRLLAPGPAPRRRSGHSCRAGA